MIDAFEPLQQMRSKIDSTQRRAIPSFLHPWEQNGNH